MASNPVSNTFVMKPFPAIQRGKMSALQVNLGYRCNQACSHCHVDAGPNRTEMMDEETINLVLQFASQHQLDFVDLTGGAPELNPYFRHLVVELRRLDTEVIDRCNLTILEEPGQDDLAEFLAEHQVKVVASMPCYSEENVDLQRGKGVFEKSIRGLQKLNALGYGRNAYPTSLDLELVYNPIGPSLPPNQKTLEADYKAQFLNNYGIEFNRLLTITNMPIARFRHALVRDNQYDGYMETLVGAFQVENLNNLMCKNLISVDWRGYVYDCDFNQMLAMPMGRSGSKTHLSELLEKSIDGKAINIAEHCFGCTAGQGSSCGGALTS